MANASLIVSALLEADEFDNTEELDNVDPGHFIDAMHQEASTGKITAYNCHSANTFYHRTERYKSRKRGVEGAPYQARRNGATKTWKSRPGEFKIPIKIGFKSYGYIDQNNADEWSTVPDFREREAAAAEEARKRQLSTIQNGPVQRDPDAPPAPPPDPNQLDLFHEHRARFIF